MVRVKKAEVNDIQRIMSFIDEHWQKDHIMAVDRTMFEFQHLDGDDVHYLICENTDNGDIYGAMGYIAMSSYDYPVISMTMAMSIKNDFCAMPIDMITKYFIKNIKCYNLISLGVEKRYALTIKKIGGYVDKLNHYYQLNPEIDVFKIARINNKNIIDVKGNLEIEEIYSFEEFSRLLSDEILKKYLPPRDNEYVRHRYFNHPYYLYRFFNITNNNAVIVGREECIKDRKILRIVDYFGYSETISGIGKSLRKLMVNEGYEYIDFYCYGLSEKIMSSAGFILNNDADGNIIPEHFSPFEQKNIDLYFYTWSDKYLRVYKAFGDQDRPNSLWLRNHNVL